MKRRNNAELAKMRRPIKKNKIAEGFYASALLYVKFIAIWILVIFADYLLDFRFEFLWSFYLLIRSVYDSFKYKGLPFSIFYVLISLTSDMLCYFFIPVQWLFFAASSFVWVQYVWHTDKGICGPTVVLWILFIYLEAVIRLRDDKYLPGHLDLCRPFAAHCIGYPVVTLGFGFKSYIGYRMRQRMQFHIAKENIFYMQLMQQALPLESSSLRDAEPLQIELTTTTMPTPMTTSTNVVVPTTTAPSVQNNHKIHHTNHSHNNTHNNNKEKNGHIPNGTTLSNGISHHGTTRSHNKKAAVEKSRDNSTTTTTTDYHSDTRQNNKINHSHHHNIMNNCPVVELQQQQQQEQINKKRERREQDNKQEREAHEYLQRLEMESRRLKIDLTQSRASEQELRIQVASLTTMEKGTKGELLLLQRQIEDLQEKLHNSHSLKQADRQTIVNLEKKLSDEKRFRANADTQLSQERKNRKQEEARLVQIAQQSSSRTECTELCKSRRRELENEINDCRQTQRWSEERCKTLELDKQVLSEQVRDTEMLMSALNQLQEKNAHLENALSAETRIKLDLFSALGEARRHLEISQNSNKVHEKEIDCLKSKIAQVLAVMPNDSFNHTNNNSNSPSSSSVQQQQQQITTIGSVSRVRLAESPPSGLSKLDPNATAYTPKNTTPNSSLITSTEA